MGGADRNCLEWLELEDDGVDDDEISEWDAATEITIFGPTKATRKLRPSTLEPVPPTPKAEPPCFGMTWMLQWWVTAPQRPPILLGTILPVGVSGTTLASHRGDATAQIEDSCCSTAASSIAEDPEITPKSIETKQVTHCQSSQLEDRFASRGNAQDYDYREYLTTKYRPR